MSSPPLSSPPLSSPPLSSPPLSSLAHRLALALLAPFALAFAVIAPPARAAYPVPVVETVAGMRTEIYRPPGDGPFPVVIFSHGRSPDAAERAAMNSPILAGHADYWVGKGFAVVAPIRPGYGATGGPDVEKSGASWDAAGQCLGAPSAVAAANAGADAVQSALNWVRHQPWAEKDRIVLVGQSFGGLTSVALGGRNPPGVVAVVNFSGGTGGNPKLHPGVSCGVPDVGEVYAQAGRAKIRNLWLYAPNVLFWGAEAPRQWAQRFTKAGGHLQFVMTKPVPDADGHNLLARGGRMWSDHLNPFLKSLGF